MSEEKEFAPSRKKRLEALRSGKIPKSQSLSDAVRFLALVLFLVGIVQLNWVQWEKLIHFPSEQIELSRFDLLINRWGADLLRVVGVGLLLGGLMAWIVELVSGGMAVRAPLATSAFTVFSLGHQVKSLPARIRKGSWQGIRVVLLLMVVGSVGVTGPLILAGCPDLPDLLLLWSCLGGALIVLGLALVSFGLIEYGVIWRRWFKELSMTRTEYRQKMREEEGEPLLRALRRRLHEELSREDLIARIRQSDVIVVSKGERRQQNV